MNRARFLPNFLLAALMMAAATGSSAARAATPTATTTSVAEPKSAPQPRERFVVLPFVNTARNKALSYMEAGFAALVAERLTGHPQLQFAGGPSLVGDPFPTNLSVRDVLASSKERHVRWVITGGFERRADWQIALFVEVYDADGFDAAAAAATLIPKARVEKIAHRSEVSGPLLTATLESFTALGRGTSEELKKSLAAKFGRDHYSFALYGRGVSAYVGIGSKPSPVRAEEHLRRSLTVDPKVPETRRYLGLVFLQSARANHARAMWRYAVDLRPNYLMALTALAALDRAAGLPSARELYERILAQDPGDIEARRIHGELLFDAGDMEAAQGELEQVVRARPEDLRARRTLALVLASRKAGADLANQMAEVVRLDPENLDARMELGAAYASIGKTNEALIAYEEILRRRPRHVVAMKLAADIHRARGELDKAAAYYEKLRRLSPTDPRPVFLLAAAYYKAGRLDEAERLFTEGASYPGMRGDAYSNLGAISLRRGNVGQALWYLQRAAQKQPRHAGVRYNYGLALSKAERHEDALTELKAAAQLNPRDAGVHFLTGVVALRLGRIAEAEQEFRDATDLDPSYEDARHNLSLLESLISSKSEKSMFFGGP